MRAAQATLRAIILLLAAVPAAGEPRPADELQLGDGRLVRLAGIVIAPAVAEGGTTPAPAGLRLEPAVPPQDRYGRLRAQVHTDDGRWLQGELVRQGVALAAPAEDVSSTTISALLALEREARAAARGVWAGAAAGPWPAASVAARPERYGLVGGRVTTVARARGFVYLNFGRRWRTDFTLRAEDAVARRLARQGLELERLAGRNLMVRGTIFETDGPMIELVHAAQIEVLE